MKFILLSIVALCVSAYPYEKTIKENLASNASLFLGALEEANEDLATALNTTGACPCNVFLAYGLEQIPVFKEDYITCAGNATTANQCIVDKICTPFTTLAGNACGGYFNASLSAEDAGLVKTLITACETLINSTISINDTCKSENVTDYTVFAVNAKPSSDLVQYHVVRNAYTVSTLPSKIFVPSMYKDSKQRAQYVEIVNSGTTVRVATDFVKQLYANVTHTFAGSNGFVHMLSSPMSLPLSPSSVLSQLPALSNLSASVTAENLATALDDMDQLTLLAPNNSGFEAFPFFGNLSDKLRTSTLESHLIQAGVFFSPQVLQSNGVKLNTTSGLELQIKVEGDFVGFVSTVDGKDLTAVVMTDIVTSNGVIHIVEDVLRPMMSPQDNNIVDNMILDERLAGFTSLIANSAPEFLAKLRSARNITLFAPQSLSSTGELGISQVAALLDYHTLEQEVLSPSLSAGKNNITTALKDEEFVRLDGANQSLFVVYTPATNTSSALVQLQSSYVSNNVNVTYANLECEGNNVIHIVSAPATVPTSTISTLQAGGFEFLGDSFGNNTDFAEMIDGHLPNKFNNMTQTYTVFAAANSAYSSLSAEANVTALSVMQDQVIHGRVFSAGLVALLKSNNNTQNLVMLSGRNVTAELRGDDVYVGGWKVITVDVLTANGVIHVLEGAVGTSAAEKTTDGLSAGVLAAIIVGGVAALGLVCYCFFMKGEDGTAEETQAFARIP